MVFTPFNSQGLKTSGDLDKGVGTMIEGKMLNLVIQSSMKYKEQQQQEQKAKTVYAVLAYLSRRG